jgi:alpha-aminoadipic semialdehyde synthase
MMAVDILPASIPLDASEHFSNALNPYLKNLVREYRGEKTETEYIESLNRATVARDGDLLPKHKWLWGGVNSWRGEDAAAAASSLPPPILPMPPKAPAPKPKKKVLMLGSGMVAGPAVDEIAKRSDIELLVGWCSTFRVSQRDADAAPQLATLSPKPRV